MALSSDQLVDRRRMQRRLVFWRLAALVALGIALVVAGWRLTGAGRTPGFLGRHVARVSVNGLITGERETVKLLHDVETSDAEGVILSIDSPGGTTSGSERLYQAIRHLAEKKPTVAVVRGLAASGGYIAALGADYIVAQDTSLVGSIGVLFQFPNVTKALNTIGVSVETIKSTPLKAAPSGFEPTSPEAKAAIAALVSDSYDWFKGLVKERRKMSDDELAAVDDGRVFTGRQGLGLHLVDALGEEQEAMTYLETARHVPKGLPIRDWKKDGGLGALGLFTSAARALGLSSVSRLVEQGAHLAESQSLDGLLAIWHAQPVE